MLFAGARKIPEARAKDKIFEVIPSWKYCNLD